MVKKHHSVSRRKAFETSKTTDGVKKRGVAKGTVKNAVSFIECKNSKADPVKRQLLCDRGKSESQGLSRGQRRRQEKNDRIQRKRNFTLYMETLREKDENKSKFGAFSEFQDIKDCLNIVSDSCQVKEVSKVRKGMTKQDQNRIAQEEQARFQAILNFSQYQNDPLGTMYQHLSNTIGKTTS